MRETAVLFSIPLIVNRKYTSFMEEYETQRTVAVVTVLYKERYLTSFVLEDTGSGRHVCRGDATGAQPKGTKTYYVSQGTQNRLQHRHDLRRPLRPLGRLCTAAGNAGKVDQEIDRKEQKSDKEMNAFGEIKEKNKGLMIQALMN
ncbi:MAG: hypothetical protein ACLR8Y_16115 [Alistipes indistinctus]